MALPAAPIAALLLIVTWWEGAFAIKYWGAVAIFALVALASWAIRSPRCKPSVPTLVAIVALWMLCAWTLLSMVWSASSGGAWEDGSRAVLYAALATAVLGTGLSPRQGRLIGWTLVAGVTVLAIVTLAALRIDPHGYFVAGRLELPIGHASATAAYFAAGFWPLIVLSAGRGTGPALRAVALTAASLCLGLSFLAQSRGVLLGLAAGALVALALGGERLRRAWLTLLVGGATAVAAHWLLMPYRLYESGGTVTSDTIASATNAVLILALVVAVAGALSALIEGRLQASHKRWIRRGAAAVLATGVAAVLLVTIAFGDPVGYGRQRLHEFRSLHSATYQTSRFGSLGGQRYDIWRVAWKEFSSKPLTGVGAASYPFDYYQQRRTPRNTSDPHSLPLRLLAETGIVGALLFAAFLGGLLIAGVKGWTSASPVEHRAAIAFASGGAVVLGHSLVEWLWVIPGVMGLGILLLALAVTQLEGQRIQRSDRTRPALRIALGLGLIAAALSVSALWLSDASLRNARGAQSPQARLAAARTAESLNPWSLPARYLKASAFETAGSPDAARAALHEALRLEPRNFVTLGLLGDLEVRAGKTRAARSYYSRALALNPRDSGLRLLAEGRQGR